MGAKGAEVAEEKQKAHRVCQVLLGTGHKGALLKSLLLRSLLQPGTPGNLGS